MNEKEIIEEIENLKKLSITNMETIEGMDKILTNTKYRLDSLQQRFLQHVNKKETDKCKGCENLSREFEKLLLMLNDKFPEAYTYWKNHLLLHPKINKIGGT